MTTPSTPHTPTTEPVPDPTDGLAERHAADTPPALAAAATPGATAAFLRPLRALGLALATVLVVAACTTGATPAPATADPMASHDPMTSDDPMASHDPMMSDDPMTSGGALMSDEPMMGAHLTQPWATAELTDVRTGRTFRIADIAAEGKVVFIETMAIWCTKCRVQQGDAVAALAGLDPARVQWIAIDVDRGESPDALAAYSEKHGFDWPYVVASDDLARGLAAEFGDGVLAPPSTPIIVIGTDGTLTLTEFGNKSVDRIRELAAAHGA